MKYYLTPLDKKYMNLWDVEPEVIKENKQISFKRPDRVSHITASKKEVRLPHGNVIKVPVEFVSKLPEYKKVYIFDNKGRKSKLK